ncbi:MAG: hypothetical protein LBM96_02450 [Methanobrevibacter sp.]|jgi:uncharacterized protein (DUF1778 family)|nr:hypothetical protein [Candidatus Methanoflexus mossambicus]
MASAKKGINIRIKEEIKDDITILANLKELSLSAYINELITNEVKENKEVIESYKQLKNSINNPNLKI